MVLDSSSDKHSRFFLGHLVQQSCCVHLRSHIRSSHALSRIVGHFEDSSIPACFIESIEIDFGAGIKSYLIFLSVIKVCLGWRALAIKVRRWQHHWWDFVWSTRSVSKCASDHLLWWKWRILWNGYSQNAGRNGLFGIGLEPTVCSFLLIEY